MIRVARIVFAAVLTVLLPAAAAAADGTRDALWAAVRNADAEKVKAALDAGADVNARNEMGISALWIAGGKGNLEVVELLLKRGADPNARDGIWYQTPLSQAAGAHPEIVKALLQAGARDGDAALLSAAGRNNLAVAEAVLAAGKVRPEALNAALFAAPASAEKLRAALTKAGAEPLKPAAENDLEAWARYAGTYESDNGGRLAFEVKDVGLVTRGGLGSGQALRPTGPDAFAPVGLEGTTYTFERQGDTVPRVVTRRYTAEIAYHRSETKPVVQPARPPQEAGDAPVTAPLNWPSFRGPDATGVADGQHPPVTWDVKAGTNVRWKTPIPGLGHSCPVVWGDRVFLTTAISGDPNPKVRIGNYGDVGSVDDATRHVWRALCLDRDTGKVLWDNVAFEGVPKTKRHLKGSQANCTPATDGKRVVACFGPEGMYCYDFAGKLLWKRDLGTLDSSFSLDREYEWGFGSSPVIHDGLVILQCDVSKDSFLAAFSLEDGSRVWMTPRDEIPSWSSPALWRAGGRVELVTNAAQYARGYDPATGKELWRLAKKSETTIPAPVVGPDAVYISSGNRPIQPIIAVRPGATGDVSLAEKEDRNAHVVWSKMRGGPYMATPILYRGHLYVLSNAGILTAYVADTGKEVYKERVGGVSYTASPVAADGRLYLVSEQGEVRVVKADGAKTELLAVNKLDEVCLATPAISAGTLFVRTQHHLYALGRAAPAE
jgi:outer membrane protein assembly factor BamB